MFSPFEEKGNSVTERNRGKQTKHANASAIPREREREERGFGRVGGGASMELVPAPSAWAVVNEKLADADARLAARGIER